MIQKVITLCLWRRPKYTRRVLDALRACRGIGNYTIFAHVDGGKSYWDPQDEVIQEVQKIDFALFDIVASRDNLGCNQSTRAALRRGFEVADFVIHLEDDIVLSPDALCYFEWAQQFQSDPSIWTVSAWRHPAGWQPSSGKPKPANSDRLVGTDIGLWIWGWATWKDRWQEMEARWTPQTNDQVASWDYHLQDNVKGSRLTLLPHTSRSSNIGDEGGIHRGACPLEYWAKSPGFDAKPVCYLAPPTFVRV